MSQSKSMESIRETIIIWLLNIGAWCLMFIPLLQFVAIILAIIVSVTTIIINWDKIKTIFKL